MNEILFLSVLVLWGVVLFVGFLLLGTLRALGVVRWRLEQLQATTPSRIGRDGLKLGTKAPAFTLPTADDQERSLNDFLGRRVLLVFTQSGCGPCHAIVPELNRVQDKGEHQVVVVNNGDPDETRRWADRGPAPASPCSSRRSSACRSATRSSRPPSRSSSTRPGSSRRRASSAPASTSGMCSRGLAEGEAQGAAIGYGWSREG